jgi:hypothetical protein
MVKDVEGVDVYVVCEGVSSRREGINKSEV